MTVLGKWLKISLKAPNSAASATGKHPATAQGPQPETPNTSRASNTAATGKPRPRSLGTYVIELLTPDFVRRREAKKNAPHEAHRQVKAILQAVKDDNLNAANAAMSKLEHAVAPLLSKKPNAPTGDELIASFLGDQVPTKLNELQTLREGLRTLISRQKSDRALELPLFVVEANMLKLQTKLFQNGQFSSIDKSFFHPASLTKLDQLTVTQLELLAKMNPLAASVKQHAERLSRDDKIPGTDLTLSSAKSIAARTGAAELRWAEREQLLSGDLNSLSIRELGKLMTGTKAWVDNLPGGSADDAEMNQRHTNTLIAHKTLQARTAERHALLTDEGEALSIQQLEDLLSKAKQWINDGPGGARPDPEMVDMCRRIDQKLKVAEMQAEMLTLLLKDNVDGLGIDALQKREDDLTSLGNAVPMTEELHRQLVSKHTEIKIRKIALEKS